MYPVGVKDVEKLSGIGKERLVEKFTSGKWKKREGIFGRIHVERRI